MSNEEKVEEFEDLIGRMKKRFLDSTEVSTSEGASSMDVQDVSHVVAKLDENLDTLYRCIRELIDNDGALKENSSLDMHSLHQLFERKGIFTAMKNNQELKGMLIRSLDLNLKEYPYTQNVNHVRKVQGTPHKIQIIPNTED
jgi:hypothetical protein